MRILSLGDSYTIGEGVAESESWPVRLVGLLRESGVKADDPVIIARTGWTTDELAVAIDVALPRGSFDLVTLLIGVNDQYRGRSVHEYRIEFRPLLARAIEFANGTASHAIVLSIPDWSATPFAAGRDRAAIASEIDAFNAVNREEASLAGAQWVDITELSRLAADQPALIASDGLHPSGAMYALWAARVFETVNR